MKKLVLALKKAYNDEDEGLANLLIEQIMFLSRNDDND
jgi:hypothetical protein